ncbi:ribonuclease Y [Candidatus Gottesmanbacteria bacterium RBG_16_52_11]|uniref:Ribonuclease Y n=1 Tax=Candidatus Gottesmanbacteria bacterium RBG_16_52_11 TaxID=1798374 RepID=A0A1F5YY26_9BACT|nr:MAG: ribonuclease Y [Candidatus Gottesmanbacteria bacterium RBG_16_52_11]
MTPDSDQTAAGDRRQLEAQVKLAEAKAKELVLEAKDEAYRLRQQAEAEARRKLEQIEHREGALEERERIVNSRLNDLDERIAQADRLKADHLKKLENIGRLTHEEAKIQILTELKSKLREEIAREIREAQAEAHEVAEQKAKEILIDAMRHGATDYVAEYTVSVIKVPDEDVKGRIIGKEGRNIRAFETATGVDVDLDEEGVIRLSSFDPVRREIARVTMERLIRDGRIQPGRIEDVVEQVKKEIERIMFEEGQKLCHAVGVYNLPAPLVAMLGRFKYRFSYGQNMVAHTLEETKIGIALSREVNADVNVIRLGCLLHDIGKVVTDKEGNHIDLGVELLKKYGIPQKVIDCVAQHHEDVPFSSVESVLVYVSDAISGSRPGARYENYEEYIKRLTDLETIAKSREGVREAFAFQAGRELRVIVDPLKVDDPALAILARDVKKEIEDKVTYPGQVKVSVIRELRATEVAK